MIVGQGNDLLPTTQDSPGVTNVGHQQFIVGLLVNCQQQRRTLKGTTRQFSAKSTTPAVADTFHKVYHICVIVQYLYLQRA